MGKTMYEKIIESHLAKVLPDGRNVLYLDWVWGHEITTPNAILDMQICGRDFVFDPNKIKMMIDHVNPAKDTASAVQGKILREWCKKHGIEFLDVGRNGVCHAIIPEKGWILPGQIGIMGDSHTCTHGAFGALAAGVGTSELRDGIIAGLWICPPQKVIRVNFIGKLPANVFAKDLILTLISEIGVKGATNAVLEFGGNVIDEMSMEGRMTIANMAVEAGATSGMMMVDNKTIEYLSLALIKKYGNNLIPLRDLNSDLDAQYDWVIEIDVSGMVPVVTNNYSPDDVVSVSKLADKKVDQVYIGSCTNGRIEDLRIAASVFEAFGGVADGVRCIIVPATQRVYEMAVYEGLINIFLKAGCFVSGPTCGACLGMSCGVLAPGEICVSTTNRNFLGRMGKGGMVHLVSPATAAKTAIKGNIDDVSAGAWCLSRRPNGFEAAQSFAKPTDWKDVKVNQINYKSLASKQSGSGKNFSGVPFYLPIDNIDTDQIIPAKYLTETGKDIFGEHCLEGALIPSQERQKFFQSQIIVAGENFGCGSSREQAVWALEAAGIKCVIAPSFARIFYNNMFANGLLCIEGKNSKKIISELFKHRPEQIVINASDNNGDPGFWWVDSFGDNIFVKFSLSSYQKELLKNGGSIGSMLNLAAEIYKF